MGMHYAYSDIVLDALPNREIRLVVALFFLVSCTPAGSLMYRHIRHSSAAVTPATAGGSGSYAGDGGPSGSIMAAISVTGVSFVMDTVMPVSVGSVAEDVVRGLAALLLVHSMLGNLNGDVESFAMWTIARRFSGILRGYGFLETVVSVAVCMGIVKAGKSVLGGDTVHILHDLLVLVAVFLVAGWTIDKVQTGNAGDTIVLLVSVMCIVKTSVGSFN